jgi:hypothetical protein
VINHISHVENAVRALSHFDGACTGSDYANAGYVVATALRVLLYEPVDGCQGEFMSCRGRCCHT